MRELEKEIEREVLEVESRGKKKKKKKSMRYMGIRVCCRKNKKKKMKHMDERIEILLQYFYSKF